MATKRTAIAAWIHVAFAALVGFLFGAVVFSFEPSPDDVASTPDVRSPHHDEADQPVALTPSHEDLRTDSDPSRAAVATGLESTVERLSAELGRIRQDALASSARIEQLQSELEFAREYPKLDFLRRFKALEMTQGLNDEEKVNVFHYIVEPLWELPQPEQVRPLADSIGRYKAALAKWDWEWIEDPAGPQGDHGHPDAQRLFDAHEAIRMRWLGELVEILGDPAKALQLLPDG